MSKVDACGAGSRARSSPAGRDRLQPGRARPAPWNPRSWRGEAKRPRRAEAGPARRRDGEARGRRRTREVEGEAHSNSLSRVRIFSWSCWRRTREVEGEARGRQRGGSGLDGAVLRGAESRAPRAPLGLAAQPALRRPRPTGRGPFSRGSAHGPRALLQRLGPRVAGPCRLSRDSRGEELESPAGRGALAVPQESRGGRGGDGGGGRGRESAPGAEQGLDPRLAWHVCRPPRTASRARGTARRVT